MPAPRNEVQNFTQVINGLDGGSEFPNMEAERQQNFYNVNREVLRKQGVASLEDLQTKVNDSQKGFFRKYLVDLPIAAAMLPFKIADLPFKGVDAVAGRTVGNITRVAAITGLLWYFLGNRARDMADFVVNAGGEASDVASAASALTPTSGLTAPGVVVSDVGTGILPSTLSPPGTTGNIIPD